MAIAPIALGLGAAFGAAAGSAEGIGGALFGAFAGGASAYSDALLAQSLSGQSPLLTAANFYTKQTLNQGSNLPTLSSSQNSLSQSVLLSNLFSQFNVSTQSNANSTLNNALATAASQSAEPVTQGLNNIISQAEGSGMPKGQELRPIRMLGIDDSQYNLTPSAALPASSTTSPSQAYIEATTALTGTAGNK